MSLAPYRGRCPHCGHDHDQYLVLPTTEPDPEIERLAAENAELRADAVRYRWLRRKDAFISRFKVEVWEAPMWQCREGDELDAAIDAALRQRAEQEEN